MIVEPNSTYLVTRLHQIVTATRSMRLVLLAVVVVVSPVNSAWAQGRNMQSRFHPAGYMTLGVITSSSGSYHDAVILQLTDGERARGKGALYGLGIGALLGAVGLAVSGELLNDNSRGEYRGLYLMLGAAGGGAVGAVVGAIIGAPKEAEPQPARLRLLLVPEASGRGTILFSLPFPSP